MLFYHIVSDMSKTLISVDNIGFSSNPLHCHFGPGQRNIYLIHYITDGHGFFNGHRIGGGQGFLIHPYHLDHYYADPDDPWTYLWITSRDPKIEDFFDTYNADPDTLIFSYDYIPTIRETMKLLRRNHNKYYSPPEINEIFLHMYNKQKKASESAVSEPDNYYKYAVSYIESNLYRQITVNELTNLLGISQPYLYKIFMDKCGMSPKRFILDLKCGEAKRLLAGTDMSVTEVANSVGYADVMTFSKFFRKETGMSPKAFRI